MPAKAHSSEYTILAALALLTGAVLAWMIWAGMADEGRRGQPGVRTTRSANIDGLLACYTLFERQGIAVQRSDSLLLADRLSGVGVIFLIDPMVPVREGEMAFLRTWLADGGVLVTTERLGGLVPGLGPSILPGGIRHWALSEAESAHRPAAARLSSEALLLPLARDVGEVYFRTDDILEEFPKDEEDGENDDTNDGAGSGAVEIELERQDEDETGGEVVSEDDDEAEEPAAVGLFADGRGLRIGEYPVGRGRLILLADSSFMTNRWIAIRDNPVLAVNLASYALAWAGGRKVAFDEYHFGYHGFEGGFGVLASLLFTSSAGWSVLVLTAAGILLLIYWGSQFGPRRNDRTPRRRSKMEYVRAVGATYLAAGAHRLTLRLIYGCFRQEVARRAGLAANLPSRKVAEELARRNRADADEYHRALGGCERLLARGRVSHRQLTAAVGRLAKLEKELLDGLGNGKRTGR